MTENSVHTADAVIDNGSFGTRTVRFETGRLALQAAGSVAAYLDDDTMLLSATTAGKHPKENLDFVPLTVDVEERMYAAGLHLTPEETARLDAVSDPAPADYPYGPEGAKQRYRSV